MERAYVIILANGLNGLGAVRSAAAAGLKVYTILTRPSDLTAESKFAQNRFLLPTKPTLADVKSVLDEIYFIEDSPGVLFACSDFAAELLGNLKTEGYSRHHLLVPTAQTATILNDKKLECCYMENDGIPLPKTYYNLANETPSSFPIIVKPRTFREQKILGTKNLIITDKLELDGFRSNFSNSIENFIAQEVILGKDNNLWVCNVTFDKNHELTACFVFNRLGTMPSHYGVTSLAISRKNERLREECQKIGKALNYTGPAMIEFKKDDQSDDYYYIETNPRLGMCNWFDTRCGINNILACAHIAYEKEVAFHPQTNNMIYWNFFGDLVARLENRETCLSILLLYATLLFRRRVGAVFYWNDLRPALAYSYISIIQISRRVIRKTRKSFKLYLSRL